jgi:hypothetical protein
MNNPPCISDLCRDQALREIFRRAEGDSELGALLVEPLRPIAPKCGAVAARELVEA